MDSAVETGDCGRGSGGGGGGKIVSGGGPERFYPGIRSVPLGQQISLTGRSGGGQCSEMELPRARGRWSSFESEIGYNPI
jgi:hypothetical protein